MKKIKKEFLILASLLYEIMCDESWAKGLPKNFKLSEKIKLKTAKALQNGFEKGDFKADEGGAMYYAGMTEDYGGFIEKEMEKVLPKTPAILVNDPVSIENGVLKSKLRRAKKALQTIADAGNENTVKISSSDAKGFVIIAKLALEAINKKQP